MTCSDRIDADLDLLGEILTDDILRGGFCRNAKNENQMVALQPAMPGP